MTETQRGGGGDLLGAMRGGHAVGGKGGGDKERGEERGAGEKGGEGRRVGRGRSLDGHSCLSPYSFLPAPAGEEKKSVTLSHSKGPVLRLAERLQDSSGSCLVQDPSRTRPGPHWILMVRYCGGDSDSSGECVSYSDVRISDMV